MLYPNLAEAWNGLGHLYGKIGFYLRYFLLTTCLPERISFKSRVLATQKMKNT